MRVDPQNPAAGSSSSGRVEDTQAQSGQVRGPQQSSPTAPNDTVQLSSGQETVRQLVAQLVQVPDIRQENVLALRSAIESGQYAPSDRRVGEALASQSFGISQSL